MDNVRKTFSQPIPMAVSIKNAQHQQLLNDEKTGRLALRVQLKIKLHSLILMSFKRSCRYFTERFDVAQARVSVITLWEYISTSSK
jgi:hypothetical protein